MREVGEILKTASGFEWKISNFWCLSEAWYRSPLFTYNNEFWYLDIWPNRSEYYGSDECIVLCLVKKSGDSAMSIELSLALKSVNGQKVLEKHSSDTFEEEYDEHEFPQLISRSELVERQSELLPADSLTVVCSLKNKKSTENASNISAVECSYCKEIFEAEIILSHEIKCLFKPVKCPECSIVVPLHSWYEHQCQISKAEGVSNTSVIPVFHSKNKILLDYKKIFHSQEHCDVMLKVKEWEFSAHKAILTARSPVFASTFRNDMKEKELGIVEIEDCDPLSFSDFLHFLYCGDEDIITTRNVFGIFTTADKYDVSDLRTKCLEFIKYNLSVDAFCEILSLALQHSETDLIHSATNFFIENIEEILETAKWQSFAAENATYSNELVIKYVKSVKGSHN